MINIIVGIYCITNKENGKKYIGQSNNVVSRWSEHIKVAYSNDEKRKSLIHKAIKKYGVESFIFEIICVCPLSELNEKEIYYISEYKNEGYTLYNETEGGDASPALVGEQNVNSKLKEADVIEIRTRYANHENKNDVFKLFADKVNINGFSSVWNGQVWKHIMMEVYTEENRKFHKANNKKSDPFMFSNFTESDVRKIRDLRQSGYCGKEVYEMYKFINYSSFCDIWYYRTFPNIKSNLEKKKTRYIRKNQDGVNNACALFDSEQVKAIRKRKQNGEDIKDVYRDYETISKFCTFRNIWNNKSYKNEV